MVDVDRARRTKVPRPQLPGLNVNARVRRILTTILRDLSILGRSVDHVLVAQFAVGATAWFKDGESALRLVLWAWARLASWRGFLRDDWGVLLTRELTTESSLAIVPPAPLAPWAGTPEGTLAPRLNARSDLPTGVDPAEFERIRVHLEEIALIAIRSFGSNWEAVKDRLRLRVRLRREEGIDMFDGIDLAREAVRLGLSFEGARYCMHLGVDLDELIRSYGIYSQDVAYYVELGLRTAQRAWSLGNLPPRRR